MTPVESSSPAESDDARDAQFIELLRAFRRSGGLAREVEVLEWLRGRRSLASRDDGFDGAIVGFAWGGRFWLPWFQFDRARMTRRPGPAKVIDELARVFDGWEMALWFARPNLWIGEARPIDRIDACPVGVFGAARADRSIAEAARPRRADPSPAPASLFAAIAGGSPRC